MTVSLYNKWRPLRFADMIGQEHVTRTLQNALACGQLGHAYLFSGPRGTGKTTAARILARAVNCRQGILPDPCNRCETCTMALEGRSFDIIEIDAASNTGVDDIRELREKVNFVPTHGRYKVYIIDEVHMLSTGAFNALLKTLEEPPPHVLFVLATTEVHRVPATILSRCQRFEFRRVPFDALVARLRQIAAAEGAQVEDRALELIARYGTGSVRDAISLLDQAITFCGTHVTAEAVRAMLGAGRSEAAAQLAAAIVRRDVPAGLRLINQALADGLDLRQFNREVVEYLRGVLLAKTGASVQELAGVTEETEQEMIELARQIETPDLLHAVRLFAQADSALRYATQPQLPLELALVESALGAPRELSAAGAAPAARSRPTVPLRPIDRDVRRAAAPFLQPHAARDAAPREDAPPAPLPDGRALATPDARTEEPAEPAGEPAQVQGLPGESGRPVVGAIDAGPSLEEPSAAGEQRPAAVIDIELVRQVWDRVLDLVGRDSRSFQAILRDARPVRVADGVLTLEFGYAFHRQRTDEMENRIILERALRRAVGAELQVRTVLSETAQPQLRRTRYASPTSDPFVLKATRILGARVLDDE
jgi:DNA polymerase-3 subunit gamma/tau